MRLAVAVLVMAAIAVAGCGGSDDSSTAAAPAKKPTADSAVAAKVPAAVKSKGTLTIATDATYPPAEFLKPGSKTAIGFDPDLAAALGDVMGVKVQVVNAGFDGILPGLAAGKYDLGISAFTDTKEREKTVDFVTYFSAGTSFYVPASGGAAAVNTLADLCGKKVAAEKGTVQADDANAQSKDCKSSGKPGVDVLVFPDQNGANLALSSGRADVGMADSPVAAYLVKQSAGKFELSGPPYGTAPYGIAVPKGSGLAPAIHDALVVLMKRGDYTTVLKKWGLEDGAITTPVINGAVD